MGMKKTDGVEDSDGGEGNRWGWIKQMGMNKGTIF